MARETVLGILSALTARQYMEEARDLDTQAKNQENPSVASQAIQDAAISRYRANKVQELFAELRRQLDEEGIELVKLGLGEQSSKPPLERGNKNVSPIPRTQEISLLLPDLLTVPHYPGRMYLARNAFRCGYEDQELQYPTIRNLRDATYAWIIRRFPIEADGQMEAQGLLRYDMPIVASSLLKSELKEERLASSRQAAIYMPRRLAGLPKETLVDILYRREEGLAVLRKLGIQVPAPEPTAKSDSDIDDGVLISIPTNNLDTEDLGGSDLQFHEIYAVTTLLQQIGLEGLVKMGLSIDQDQFNRLIKAQQKHAHSGGKLRDPQALAHIFNKLRVMADDQLPVDYRYRVGTKEIVGVFKGLPHETVKEIVSRGVRINLDQLTS